MNNVATRPTMRLLKRALMGSAASSLVLSIIAGPAFAEDLSFPSLLPAFVSAALGWSETSAGAARGLRRHHARSGSFDDLRHSAVRRGRASDDGDAQHHRAAGRVDLPRLVLEPDGALHHHSGGNVRGSAGSDARLWHHAEFVARHPHRHAGEALPPRDHVWLVESRHARHELPGHGQPARFAGGRRLARLSRTRSTASKSISACPSRPAAITIWAAPC